MTVTFISAQPVKYLVPYGEPVELRVKVQPTKPYWLYFGLKPEAIDPYAYSWDMGELYGPFSPSDTEVILSRYVPDEWEPPADTRWLFQALVSYNETGYTGAYVLSDIMRNTFSYGAPIKVSLSITVVGGGTTTPSPGIHYYEKGDVLTITAIPHSGWKFDYWAGHTSGTQTSKTITMDKSKAIWAYFVEAPPPDDGIPPDEEPPDEETLWDQIQAWIEEHGTEIAIGGGALAGLILLWPKGK